MIARDLQTITFYDSKGAFAGVRRPGSGKPLRVTSALQHGGACRSVGINGMTGRVQVDTIELVVDGLVGSSGLELKVDPGVPWVYAGFGGMMITTLLSYISHSQVTHPGLPA